MKKILLILGCCLLVVLIVFGKSRYTSHPTNDGMLYFFYPTQVGGSQNGATFTYDLTYLHPSDTCTINFSLHTPHKGEVTELTLHSDAGELRDTTLIRYYIEPNSKGLEYRMHAAFDFPGLLKLFLADAPLSFRVVQGGTATEYTYSPAKWKKERIRMEEFHEILQMP